MAMTSTHDGFLDRLGRSHAAVTLVSYWLRFDGYTVTLPPISEAPTADQAGAHSDPGDIYAKGLGATDWDRIEVKRLTYTWTGMHDYPFPKLIVCTVDSFHRIDPPPLAHFILNDEMTHAFVAPSALIDEWWKEEKGDKDVLGRVSEYYFCKKQHVNWVKIPAMKGINATHSDRFSLAPNLQEGQQVSVGTTRVGQAEEDPPWAREA